MSEQTPAAAPPPAEQPGAELPKAELPKAELPKAELPKAEPTADTAGNAAPAAAPQPAEAALPRPHPLKQPRLAVPLLLLLFLVNLPFLHALLRGQPEVTQAVPFKDGFDRAELGSDYWSNGGHWRIVSGQLFSPGVQNNPLWLKARLPADARIELDVRSEGPDGDIKWEAFGDGRNHSTGYLFMFGLHRNAESRIAKLDEHALTAQDLRARLAAEIQPYPRVVTGLAALLEGASRPFLAFSARRDLDKLEAGKYYGPETPVAVKRNDVRVVKGRSYHMVIIKRGRSIRWEMDNTLFLELDDPSPLSGPGHDRFGFESWVNDTYFDNLKIEPL